MSFKFQNQLIYEHLRLFTKDLFTFTGKLPNYEANGLIKQIRILGMNLLQEFAQGNVRTPKSDSRESAHNCIIIVAKIASLIDLSAQLNYITPQLQNQFTASCEDLTKRLYDSSKNPR